MNTGTILTLAITSAFFLCSCMAEDSAVKTDFSLNEQEKAAEALVARVTGGHAEDFAVKITETRKDGRDWFSYYAGKRQQRYQRGKRPRRLPQGPLRLALELVRVGHGPAGSAAGP